MICDFKHCGILTCVVSDEPVQHPISLETPIDVQSVGYHSYYMQATSKGSDQTSTGAA